MAEPYVMVQVFVSFCATPEIPVLLRMPFPSSTATPSTLTSATLLKLAECKLCDTLPHNYVGGYEVYPSHGDGRCNRTTGALPSKEKLEDCSDFSFPYMVALVARRGELAEARQDEPLATHILEAYGLTASAAPRPLPAHVKEIRTELMRAAGLTESDVNRFGPREQLAPSSSQQIKVQQAMILRRREDVLAKKLRQRAKMESDDMVHAAARNEALQSQKRIEAEKKAMVVALENADPLYGARGRLENDVTRLRHKLESDLSRGNAMSATFNNKKVSSVPSSSTSVKAVAPPTSSVSTLSRSDVLEKVVAALEVSILQDYVDQQAAFRKDRDLRAKKALAAHEVMCHQVLASLPPAPVEQKILKAVVVAPAKVAESWNEKASSYDAWSAQRAQSLESVYHRAELHVLQKK